MKSPFATTFPFPPPCLSSFATSVSSICSWPLKPESNEDTFYASKVGARRKEGRGKNFVPASVVKNFPTQIYWPPPIPFIPVCFYLYARIGEDYLSFKGLRISPLHSQIPSVCFLSTINFWKEKNFLVVLLQRTKFEIDLRNPFKIVQSSRWNEIFHREFQRPRLSIFFNKLQSYFTVRQVLPFYGNSYPLEKNWARKVVADIDPPSPVKSRCFESHCFEINPSSIGFLSANRKGEEPEGDGAATDNARKHAESEAGHGWNKASSFADLNFLSAD